MYKSLVFDMSKSEEEVVERFSLKLLHNQIYSDDRMMFSCKDSKYNVIYVFDDTEVELIKEIQQFFYNKSDTEHQKKSLSMDLGNSVYNDIVQLIENEVTRVSESLFSKDECKPEFTISIGNEPNYGDIILLGCKHLGRVYTERVFPRDGSYYGYDSVADMMVNLYNRTM